VLLNDETTLPAIGYGTYPLRGDEAAEAVRSAIEVGYRHIDAAVNYQNEDAVGRGLATSDLDRAQVRVATKLPGRDHGYYETLASFERSRSALGVEFIDLYLIHWPNPSVDKYVQTWQAMIELQRSGVVRSIGVCNFTERFLTRLIDETGVVPAVNQVELHPYFLQSELREFHRVHGIVTQAWSPLGRNLPILTEPAIRRAAEAHGATQAQVVLRWHVQIESMPIPKTAHRARQRENLDIFGFELSNDEVLAITALGRPDGRSFGADPDVHEEM